ncbi:MAG: ribonuclease H-like domain-containing protein [Candidatus Rokubacteria bacterium]|nr:ribonuclease H-like domain-containing protein [Candidatus Rokubacteria bacterium]
MALPARSHAAEALVGGSLEPTPQGPILVARRRYALLHREGSVPLAAALEPPPEVLSLLARSREGSPPPHRLLYLDTETTGLAGGTGTYVFLVGVGFFDGEGFVVHQYFMRDLDEEPALLAALDALLPRFAGVVTYNGRAFDLSLLETRFVLARRPWPESLWHLDLLPAARRVWGSSLTDCRLTTVEAHALGLSRTDDVPGALIPSLYFDYLRRRHPAVLPKLFAHNRQDVLSLVALAGWMGRALSDPEGVSLRAEEYAGLGRLWEPWDGERSQRCYRAALDRRLPEPSRGRLLLRLAELAKRDRRWEEACTLWETAIAGAGFHIRPWEELAKYHEHRSRDVPRASCLVTEALRRARAAAADPLVIERLTYRLARLTRRLGDGRASPA